jgi:hypothetical protein
MLNEMQASENLMTLLLCKWMDTKETAENLWAMMLSASWVLTSFHSSFPFISETICNNSDLAIIHILRKRMGRFRRYS